MNFAKDTARAISQSTGKKTTGLHIKVECLAASFFIVLKQAGFSVRCLINSKAHLT